MVEGWIDQALQQVFSRCPMLYIGSGFRGKKTCLYSRVRLWDLSRRSQTC